MQVNFANANSGIMASSIGWFDFTGVTLPVNTTLSVSNSLPNGGNISFRLSSVNVSGNVGFTAKPSPQRAGMPFGTTGYTGIAGKPLLDAAVVSGGDVRLTIDNIQATNYNGQTIPFGLVVAEGEGSIANEFWTWGTNGTPWKLISNINGSTSNITGIGTTTVTWGGANPWPCPILSTNTPTAIVGRDIEFSQSAIAIGVILTPIQVEKNIKNRKYINDQFELTIRGPQTSDTITYGFITGLQGAKASVFAGDGETYILNENMGSGSTGILQEYIQTISIVNTAVGGTTIPSNWKLGDPLTVAMGDNITLIITNDTFPDITSTKTVNKTTATFGDILTYTVVLGNVMQTTVVNLNFIDTIPVGSTLVPNTLKINGTLTPGTPDPPGLNSIQIGPNNKTTITYNVVVNKTTTVNLLNSSSSVYSYLSNGVTIPTQNSNSNIVSTSIVAANIVSQKSVNLDYGTVGDILTYTIVLNNTGNLSANNVIFKDTIPVGSTLVSNSVFLNGTNLLGQNPTIGINIGNIAINGKATISFKVTVVSIPSNNNIQNYGNVIYSYTVASAQVSGNIDTNIVTTTIAEVDFSGILKSVDKTFLKPGDIVTYTINIPNKGNIQARNLIFYDTIPNGTTYMTNSLLINGVNTVGNLQNGVTLPNINPGETVTIQFSVVVN